MQSQRIRILLVEDDPDDVRAMRNLLRDCWDGPCELVQLDLLSAAVERCGEEPFDVVLLDLSLPDSQGLATFFTMHAHAEGVPIVVLTGHHDEAGAVQAVQAGARLPGQGPGRRSLAGAFDPLRGRARPAPSRRGVAARCHGRVSRRAANSQRLYPAVAPSLPGFEIAGALHPADATAGDYLDYIPLPENCLGVVVGAVGSHGMGTAPVISETRACLRTLAQQHSDVGEILTRANRVLAEDAGDFHFVTLAMLRLDPARRSMAYASAGQRGYLLHPGIEAAILDSTSLPLGVRADTVVPAATAIALRPGDLITFFTDGVSEAESPGRVRFGVARALQTIRAIRHRPAQEIIDTLRQDVLGFCRNRPPRHDMTIVVVKATEN